MWSLAWLFMKSNWQIVLVGIVVAAIMGYIGILKLELRHANSKVANLTAENVSLVEQVKNWQSAYRTIAEKVELQNKAITDYEQAGKEAHQKAQQALAKARLTSAYWQKVVDALKATPRVDMNCSQAILAAKGDLSGVHP